MKYSFFEHSDVKHILTMMTRFVFMMFISFIVASLIDRAFPEVNIQKHPFVLFAEITFHMIVLLIAIYFIRKLIFIIPFPPHGKSIAQDPSIDYFDIEIMISVILIGTQQRLLRKFDVIGKQLFNIAEIETDSPSDRPS